MHKFLTTLFWAHKRTWTIERAQLELGRTTTHSRTLPPTATDSGRIQSRVGSFWSHWCCASSDTVRFWLNCLLFLWETHEKHRGKRENSKLCDGSATRLSWSDVYQKKWYIKQNRRVSRGQWDRWIQNEFNLGVVPPELVVPSALSSHIFSNIHQRVSSKIEPEVLHLKLGLEREFKHFHSHKRTPQFRWSCMGTRTCTSMSSLNVLSAGKSWSFFSFLSRNFMLNSNFEVRSCEFA